MSKPKILITGTNGLVGRTLLEFEKLYLIFDVYATSLRSDQSENKQPNYSYTQVDLTKENEVASLIDSIQPNVIIHAAAQSHVDRCAENPDQCKSINVDALQNIINCAKKHQSHIIYLSTDFVFSGNDSVYYENSIIDPVNFYGELKAKAETLLQDQYPQHSIVRTILVYGAPETLSRSNFLIWVYQSLKAGKPIRVVDDQLRMPTYVGDLAQGLVNIAKGKHRGIFHLCGAERCSVYQFAIKIAEFYQLDSSLISPIHTKELKESNFRPVSTSFSLEKSKFILDYHPNSVKEALEYIDLSRLNTYKL